MKCYPDWPSGYKAMARTRCEQTDGRTDRQTNRHRQGDSYIPCFPTNKTSFQSARLERKHHDYTPCNEVRGGVYWNHHVRLSVRLSSAFVYPAHNCFPFTPIIMKLHMQTPHESRMCTIDFEVKRSKVKVTMHKLLKMISGA